MKIIKIILFSTLLISCRKNDVKVVKNPNEKAEIIQNKLSLTLGNIFSEKDSTKDYVIGNWEKDKNETHFRYLGNVVTNKKENLTLINCFNYFGEESKRGKGSIMIYQDMDK